MRSKTGTNGLLIAITVGILLLFISLEPKVSSLAVPGKSHSEFVRFIQETEKNQSVNIQSFWQFREFYSPGSYRYNPQGTPPLFPTATYIKNLHLNPTLTFNSEKLKTNAGHSILSSLSQKSIAENTKGKVLISNKSTLLVKEPDNSYLLVFLEPMGGMKKANGFLQYETAANDKAGNYWLSITLITP